MIQKAINKVLHFSETQYDLFLFLLRLNVGIIFFQAGIEKFFNIPITIAFFTKIGIPFAEINVILASTIELIGGLCLILGLFTRIASFPLSIVMIVAILTAHLNHIHTISDLVRLDAWVYLLILLILSSLGGGKWSLDHKFLKR